MKQDYPTWEALRRDVPRLILAHNLHGIDIDLRATQIAALALWLRCQRDYKDMELTKDRPKITRSNIVCAEPMPGEKEMLKEFVAELQPRVLGHLVEVVFDKMTLAAEAGSLLKIEEELRSEIASVRKQWVAEHERAVDRKGRPLLFSQAEMDRAKTKAPQKQLSTSPRSPTNSSGPRRKAGCWTLCGTTPATRPMADGCGGSCLPKMQATGSPSWTCARNGLTWC